MSNSASEHGRNEHNINLLWCRRELSPPRNSRRSPQSYRPRSRSPAYRAERADPYAADDWRRRSPSARPVRERVSGEASQNTSRRSSPPVHPSRATMQTEPEQYPPPRRHESPPPRDYPANGDGRGAAPYRNGESARPVPPSRSYGSSLPSGPSSSQVSMSAHNRPGSASVLSAPSHPRGGRGGYRGDYGSRDYPPRDPYPREYPTGPTPPRRGSYSAPRGRGGPPPPYEGGFPSGPRGGYNGGGGGHHPYSSPPSFRGNNSSSTTYPRTQRFNTAKPDAAGAGPGARGGANGAEQYLSDLPEVVPSGKKMADSYDSSKINRLEEEARKLREQIAEKESKVRQSVREWDRLQRESELAGLKAELAEGHLRALNGEDEAGGAAF
ncbi:MAG: hypothetical protein M1822_010091 [Bathelium mastoideum]|nr:MAG: hypothetical protein M1822_010091 [Bathelium mastoideum]